MSKYNVNVVKLAVMAGLFAAMYLPPEVASAIGLASNMLWLWKT